MCFPLEASLGDFSFDFDFKRLVKKTALKHVYFDANLVLCTSGYN